MGKASRNKSQRGAQSPTPFMEGMAAPLDPDTFRMMIEVFGAAASMRMPTTNPEESKVHLLDTGETLALTDTGMNRGILEVSKQCREMGIKNPQAYTARLMQMHEIFAARELFSEFIGTDEGGKLIAHDCMYEAAATARFYASPKRLGFDLDDVLRRARELAGDPV